MRLQRRVDKMGDDTTKGDNAPDTTVAAAPTGRRHSKPVGQAPQIVAEEERARRAVENGFAQLAKAEEILDQHLGTGGGFALKPWMLIELNRIAMAGLNDGPGQWRQQPVDIGLSSHQPPDWRDVPRCVDEMCDYINSGVLGPAEAAAYAMWRINWIHPWMDGNGRTARVVADLLLSVRLGFRIPGVKTIPERIVEDIEEANAAERIAPYYEALEAADEADKLDRVDVESMCRYIEKLLMAQLEDALASDEPATRSPRVAPPGGTRLVADTEATHAKGANVVDYLMGIDEVDVQRARVVGNFVSAPGHRHNELVKAVDLLKTTSTDLDKPFSVLLCGPSGAGKTFFVEELVSNLSGVSKDQIVRTNLSSSIDLATDLRRHYGKIIASSNVPRVAFLDEVDTVVAGDHGYRHLLRAMKGEAVDLGEGKRQSCLARSGFSQRAKLRTHSLSNTT